MVRICENIKKVHPDEILNRILDVDIVHQYQLEFSVCHVVFSNKNPYTLAICGLTQVIIFKINSESKALKTYNI